MVKVEIRMVCLSTPYHLTGKIHAHPIGWLTSRQQVALSATNLQYALTLRDNGQVYLRQPLMIISAKPRPMIHSFSYNIPVRDAPLVVRPLGRSSAVKFLCGCKVWYFVSHHNRSSGRLIRRLEYTLPPAVARAEKTHLE